MSRGYPQDFLRLLEADNLNWLVFCSLEFDSGPLRFFTGFGEYTDSEGRTFYGVGSLGQITNSSEDLDAKGGNYTITLSGLDTAVTGAFLGEPYLNREVFVWVALGGWKDASVTITADSTQYTADTTQITADVGRQYVVTQPVLVFSGRMDALNVEMGQTAQLQVAAGSKLLDFDRPKIYRYNDEEHQMYYPGDKGFEFVTQVAKQEVVWPAASWFRNN